MTAQARVDEALRAGMSVAWSAPTSEAALVVKRIIERAQAIVDSRDADEGSTLADVLGCDPEQLVDLDPAPLASLDARVASLYAHEVEVQS